MIKACLVLQLRKERHKQQVSEVRDRGILSEGHQRAYCAPLFTQTAPVEAREPLTVSNWQR